MKLARPSLAVFALPFVLFLSACSGATAPPATAGSTQQAIATTQPGPLRAMGAAFAEVPLSPEQRTRIEALFKQTETRHTEAWVASTTPRKDLLLALADQVQAGTIDKTALLAKAEAAAAPLKKVREQDRAALVELHKALTPEQRAAFVDALGDRKHMMRKAFGGGDAPAGENAPHAEKGKHHGGHFGKAWKELDLSSDQKDKLKDAMKAARGAKGHRGHEGFKAHHEEMKKAFESFKTDSFNGDLLPAPKGDMMLERMIKFAEVATPILTPDQRNKAAALLRDRAANADKAPFAK